MEQDLVVLCQALYHSIKEEEWIEMGEKLREVSKKTGVKKAGERVAGLGKVAKTLKESFFSAKEEQEVGLA